MAGHGLIAASGHVASALATQYLPRPALDALQLRRLRRMVRYAWERVPFYRRLWADHGVRPEQIRTRDDLRRLPIPDRRAIEERQDELLSGEHRAEVAAGRRIARMSGGSSGGRRLEMLFDYGSWRRLDAYYLRALMALGYRPWIPLVYYWGQPFERITPQGLLNVMPKVSVPARLDEAGQLLVLEQHPRSWLYYHPTALFTMARRFPDRLRGLRLERIVSTAEMLTASMRAAIERAAGCEVYDQYGTAELNRMAWECPQRDGFHVDVESVLIELVDDDGREVKPGELGRALVTGLVSTTMPLIRYELGDLMVRSDRPCACGRTLPLLASIEGRWKDRVRLPDGGTRTPRQVLEPLADLPELEELRLTVRSTSAAELEVVTPAGDLSAVAGKARAAFGRVCPGMELQVTRVPSVEKTGGGKRVMLRNLLAPARSPLAAVLGA